MSRPNQRSVVSATCYASRAYIAQKSTTAHQKVSKARIARPTTRCKFSNAICIHKRSQREQVSVITGSGLSPVRSIGRFAWLELFQSVNRLRPGMDSDDDLLVNVDFLAPSRYFSLPRDDLCRNAAIAQSRTLPVTQCCRQASRRASTVQRLSRIQAVVQGVHQNWYVISLPQEIAGSRAGSGAGSSAAGCALGCGGPDIGLRGCGGHVWAAGNHSAAAGQAGKQQAALGRRRLRRSASRQAVQRLFL